MLSSRTWRLCHNEKKISFYCVIANEVKQSAREQGDRHVVHQRQTPHDDIMTQSLVSGSCERINFYNSDIDAETSSA